MLKKKKDKCIFNENWVVDPRFKSWLKRSIREQMDSLLRVLQKKI